MGPLALMAKKAGMEVVGSDLAEGMIAEELREAGIDFLIGEQDGEFLRQQIANGVEWFVYTSSLPENSAELILAKQSGIKVSKRDELVAWLVKNLNLKMVGVAGTHGKTTTTGMIIWLCLKMGLPISYLVGTTLPFAEAGRYDEKSKFLIYEADEYDRNFLRFYPWLGVIMAVSFDHPDIYGSREEYLRAFRQFEKQCEGVLRSGVELEGIRLSGKTRRVDASVAVLTVEKIVENLRGAGEWGAGSGTDGEILRKRLVALINEFPGIQRRFERIEEGIYTDYGHHPEEVSATVEMALEEAKNTGRKGVVVVYEPHQNTRQWEVREGYRKAFLGVDKLYWLPTFLTREDESLAVLSPEELIGGLDNKEVGERAEIDESLAERLLSAKNDGFLVLLMSAGPADKWYRGIFERKEGK